MLTENGVAILKFFLSISASRRSGVASKRASGTLRRENGRFSLPDFEERQHWSNYTEAYEEVLHKCSTARAPWYVVPSDHKWFRNYVVAELIVRALNRMRLKYPPPSVDISKVTLE